MRLQILVPLAAALAIGAGSSAMAQGVNVDDPEMVVEEGAGMVVEDYPDDEVVVRSRTRPYRNPPAARYRERYVPPVYGWVQDQPLSCGTYHYWNGDRCVDARNRPDSD